MGEELNGGAGSAQDISSEINQRLALLTEAHFRMPETKPGPKATIVGTATDHIKRLFTLVRTVVEEHRARVGQYEWQVAQVCADIGIEVVPLEELKRVGLGGSFEEPISQIEELGIQLAMLAEFHDVVSRMLYAQIRRDFRSQLATRQRLFVCADWMVGWIEESSQPAITAFLVGGFGDNAGAFREFFRQ